MVIEGCDDASSLESVQTLIIVSSASSSSNDNKRGKREECEGYDEKVNITRDSNAIGKEQEGLEGESDARGIHPYSYFFI